MQGILRQRGQLARSKDRPQDVLNGIAGRRIPLTVKLHVSLQRPGRVNRGVLGVVFGL